MDSGETHEHAKEIFMITEPLTETLPVVDLTRKSVRVLERRANGFVLFEFSLGWPELAAELMLTQADFDAFCASQGVAPTEGPDAGLASSLS